MNILGFDKLYRTRYTWRPVVLHQPTQVVQQILTTRQVVTIADEVITLPNHPGDGLTTTGNTALPAVIQSQPISVEHCQTGANDGDKSQDKKADVAQIVTVQYTDTTDKIISFCLLQAITREEDRRCP
ncbi:UNVERIFIED_CONTAM: hypothetical protein FKN15_047328 [Acipenser sinensis]